MVAVQLAELLTVLELGEHVRLRVVVGRLTERLNVFMVVAWAESPP